MSQLVKGLGLQNHSYTRLIHELGRSRENKLGMSLKYIIKNTTISKLRCIQYTNVYYYYIKNILYYYRLTTYF
jgi:hypothetical protein